MSPTRLVRAATLIAVAALAAVSSPSARAQEGTENDPFVRPFPDLVTAETARAIELGVRALVKLQRTDGSWLSEGENGQYPCAMTSLAGMALLSAGHAPTRGVYATSVYKAVVWSLKQQTPDGCYTGGGEMRNMYGHGFTMLFLGSVFGNIPEGKLHDEIKKSLNKAVELTIKAQSDAGGWYYTPESRSDEGSVTVTQMQGLRACRNSGINVPESVMVKAVAYLKHCQMDDGGICYSARNRGQSRPAISAAAVSCMYSAGAYDDPIALKCIKYCKGQFGDRPYEGGFYFYTNFYWAQAMYQLGGDDWRRFYPQMQKSILTSHRSGDTWTESGFGGTGQVLGTAMAVMILALPYCNVPIFQR